MERVRIVSAAVSHPPNRIGQAEAASRVAESVGLRRHVEALARGSQIESRASVLPPDEVISLGSIQERNAIYEVEAPRLAHAAAIALQTCFDDVSFLATSSCTGYMVPGLDVELSRLVNLAPNTVHVPITEAGCAGGAVAIARAVDKLRVKPAAALVVAAELCSLAFHPDGEEGNLTSALLFGDGAGAVYLESGDEHAMGLEIVDCASFLVPSPAEVLGFRLTNNGFYPLLSRRLVECLPGAVCRAIEPILSGNGLRKEDIGFWLLHPGGPRVLDVLQRALGVEADRVRWSWDTLRHSGNTSSAAIMEVLARYLADPNAPEGWGMAMAFGPGISIEMLLLRRC